MKYLPQTKIKEFRDENKGQKCPIFDISLKDAVVDHDHSTGVVRGCIHRQSNAWEGKVYNAWKRYGGNNANVTYIEALRNLADYIEGSNYDLLHPVGVTQLCKRFSRLTKKEQEFSLELFKYATSEIKACTNSKERVKLYRIFLTKDKYGKTKSKTKNIKNPSGS
jgi:hypothetical protein